MNDNASIFKKTIHSLTHEKCFTNLQNAFEKSIMKTLSFTNICQKYPYLIQSGLYTLEPLLICNLEANDRRFSCSMRT